MMQIVWSTTFGLHSPRIHVGSRAWTLAMSFECMQQLLGNYLSPLWVVNSPLIGRQNFSSTQAKSTQGKYRSDYNHTCI